MLMSWACVCMSVGGDEMKLMILGPADMNMGPHQNSLKLGWKLSTVRSVMARLKDMGVRSGKLCVCIDFVHLHKANGCNPYTNNHQTSYQALLAWFMTIDEVSGCF